MATKKKKQCFTHYPQSNRTGNHYCTTCSKTKIGKEKSPQVMQAPAP